MLTMAIETLATLAPVRPRWRPALAGACVACLVALALVAGGAPITVGRR